MAKMPILPPAAPVVPNAGAPVGSPAHTAAHAGFRSKQTPIKTSRGEFSFKENKPAVRAKMPPGGIGHAGHSDGPGGTKRPINKGGD